jgi:hypothetical protein
MGVLRFRTFFDDVIETGQTGHFGERIGQSADQMWQKKGIAAFGGVGNASGSAGGRDLAVPE